MATIAGTLTTQRSTLLRAIVIGGMFIFVVQLVHMWIVYTLIKKTPLIVSLQYIASGALGMSAFEGGIAAAMLGVFFHLIISFAIAAIFILSADRIPLLRRYPIPAALLYGFGVFIVMNMVVTPLSATPPIPVPALPWLIEAIIQHVLFIGLPLGILVRRNIPGEAQS